MSNGIVICGLGAVPSEEATLEALAALGGCDEVFTILDAGSHRWLRGLLGKGETFSGPAGLLAAARRGRAGLAVWGHARTTSAQAEEVERLCAAEGVACSVLSSVSPLSSAAARAVCLLGWEKGTEKGLQAYDLEAYLKADVRASFPLVVFSETAQTADLKALAGALLKRYPKRHPILLFSASGVERVLALEELSAAAFSGGCVFVAPHAS